ncbi:MAG TPA: FecR family protein [Kofleriaceae bacterium]|nr:FecR family protein [Kofleriaceae bacterium]
MFDDADITLDADSAVVMQREPTKPTVWLERGAAWFSVAPRGGRAPFIVLAGETMVRVVGTRFRVVRNGERTDVAVEHGTVEIQFRGQLTAVAGGQTWSTHSDAPAPLPTPAPGSASLPHATPPLKAKPATDGTRDDHDQVTYDALARLEPSQPETAIRGYLELARGSGRWAALGLYSAARLAADRHDGRAATLLSSYLQRFPAGANAADVKYLLERLQGAPR